jgi:AcrR family transcriptional regulator
MIKASGRIAVQNSAAERAAPMTGADTQRREAIVKGAEEVFLEEGFQAASMNAIAVRAGVAKGTLYNYFASKEELFLACVSRHCEELQAQMSSLAAEGGDLRTTLNRLGRRYVEVVASDNVIRKFRMIVAEAERSPEMAQAFYEMGPARGAALLADFLRQAMARGELAPADPLRAARQFLGLCHNWLSKARLCNVEPAPDPADIERDVTDAVRVFLAAYGVDKPR